MDRETFLKELRIALQGQISQEEVNEHLRYYENYIIEESRKGRTESQVIEDLGNPRLIAKTIIDTTDKVYTDQQPLEEEGKKTGGNKAKIFRVVKLIAFFVVLILMLVLIAHVALLLLPIFLPIVMVTGIAYFLFFSNRK
ncbi:MAG: DUF1700 domain-containing protein [Roseburia sp.]|nr:DUF1700 domain-containing protein [Roseburia sp.]